MKQVIVIRKDLNMRKGKMVAQGAHASVGAVMSAPHKNIEQWMNDDACVKICVGCDSEKELLELFNEARRNNVVRYLVTDAGRTEFNGVPTKTCIALGPDEDHKIDAITGNLKLL